jgi:benzodiazapine receptor
MSWKRVLISIAPPVVAAAIGGAASRDAPRVYRRLDKPSWAPPEWAFGPVWTALYAANGVAGWRLATRAGGGVAAVHVGQLALNASWTPLFFGLGKRKPALAVSAALTAAVAAEIGLLARRDIVGAALLVPYCAWSAFATALTASVSDPPR